MAKEVLFLVEEAAEGGYIARALGHSIVSPQDFGVTDRYIVPRIPHLVNAKQEPVDNAASLW